MILFLTLISIPDKIKEKEDEYDKVINTKNIIDYVYKTKDILKEYSIEKETNKE